MGKLKQLVAAAILTIGISSCPPESRGTLDEILTRYQTFAGAQHYVEEEMIQSNVPVLSTPKNTRYAQSFLTSHTLAKGDDLAMAIAVYALVSNNPQPVEENEYTPYIFRAFNDQEDKWVLMTKSDTPQQYAFASFGTHGVHFTQTPYDLAEILVDDFIGYEMFNIEGINAVYGTKNGMINLEPFLYWSILGDTQGTEYEGRWKQTKDGFESTTYVEQNAKIIAQIDRTWDVHANILRERRVDKDGYMPLSEITTDFEDQKPIHQVLRIFHLQNSTCNDVTRIATTSFLDGNPIDTYFDEICND